MTLLCNQCNTCSDLRLLVVAKPVAQQPYGFFLKTGRVAPLHDPVARTKVQVKVPKPPHATRILLQSTKECSDQHFCACCTPLPPKGGSAFGEGHSPRSLGAEPTCNTPSPCRARRPRTGRPTPTRKDPVMASLADLDTDTLADIRTLAEWGEGSTTSHPVGIAARRLLDLLPPERMEPVAFLRWLADLVPKLRWPGSDCLVLGGDCLDVIAARWPKEAL